MADSSDVQVEAAVAVEMPPVDAAVASDDAGDAGDVGAAAPIESADASSQDLEVGEAPAAAAAVADGTKAADVVELTDEQLAALSTPELMELTHTAYKSGNIEYSQRIHREKQSRGHTEDHGGAGSDVIKSVVFGGLDGIITTFAIVAAVAGAGLDMRVIILMGFSNLLADALSMGLGDYLSSAAELEHQRNERAKEAWEFKNDPAGETAEMVELYVDKLGFTQEDAEAVMAIYTKPEYAEAFVDHMCTVELEFMPPDDDENPAWDGFVTFCSFIIFGSVPMWLYVIFFVADWTDSDTDGTRFAIACVCTALTMFALGFVKATITRMGGAIESGLKMMANGSLAAALAYFVGWGLEAALDVSSCA